MTSLLHQLENNEAILLMYLARELSAEDRAEVEQKLASDAGLAAELERLRAVRDDLNTSIGAADAATRLPVSTGVAVRRVTRMLRQWQVERLKPKPPHEPINELRFPWWSYPLTTAAAVLIAFLVWWGNKNPQVAREHRPVMEESPSGPQDLDGWRAEAIMADLYESIEIPDEQLLRMAMDARVDQMVEMLATPQPSSGQDRRQPSNELDL